MLDLEESYREVMGFTTTRRSQYAGPPLSFKQEEHPEHWENSIYASVHEGDMTACEVVPSVYFLTVHNPFPPPSLTFNPKRAREGASSSSVLCSSRP